MPRLDFCSCLVTGRLWGVLAVIALGTMAVCQPTPSSAQPPPSDDEAALEGATTTPKAVKNKPLGPTDAVLFGRWRGKTVCLDLFANGDFELSMIGGRSGKAVAIGRAKHAKKSGPQAIALEVDRIWVSRWVTACRKRNERGRFVDTRRALGVELKAGSPTTVTVRRLPDQKIELCAEACEVLIPDAPLLGGLWRRPKDSPPAKTGDIVRLDLSVGGRGTVVFVVWPEKELNESVHGKFTLEHKEGDTFRYTFEVDAVFTNPPEGRTVSSPSIMNVPIAEKSPLVLALSRLPGQRLKACTQAGVCTRLERKFNPSKRTLR